MADELWQQEAEWFVAHQLYIVSSPSIETNVPESAVDCVGESVLRLFIGCVPIDATLPWLRL